MSDYDYLDESSDDGTVLGQSTSALIGFWGITPVNQPDALTTALAAVTVVSATAYTTILAVSATSFFGWDTLQEGMTMLTVVQNIQSRLGEAEARLVEAGLIVGGTAAPTPTSYDYVGKGADEGSIFGQDSSELISFWGITPCNQPAALTAQLETIALTSSTVSTTTYDYVMPALVTSSVGYGFVSDDAGSTFCQVIQNLHARMAEIETNLVEVGVVAGGTGISVTTSAKLGFLDKGNDGGTILGYSTAQLIGFWGTTPVDQPAALTAALTTITCTLSSTTTAVYTWVEVTIMGFVFANATVGDTLIACVKNAQTRMAEMEVRLEEIGLIAAN